MLIFDFHTIGNKMLSERKRIGLTQAEVAERAGLSDRTYADIERGTVNMRIETLLRICEALHVTPNDIITTDNPLLDIHQEELFERMNNCSQKDRETALRLLSVFFGLIRIKGQITICPFIFLGCGFII